MQRSHSDTIYRQRGRVVRRARDLARSGQYPDLAAIIPLLEPLEGFTAARARFEDRALRAQLDRLCTIARDARAIGGTFRRKV